MEKMIAITLAIVLLFSGGGAAQVMETGNVLATTPTEEGTDWIYRKSVIGQRRGKNSLPTATAIVNNDAVKRFRIATVCVAAVEWSIKTMQCPPNGIRNWNMQYRTLGADLTVSAVGLGCMGMSHAYGAPADKKEMTELLAQAVDLGYTFFDTAEVYGTPDDPHDNEKLLGSALKPYRDKIVLATKFGIGFDPTSHALNKPLIPDSRPEVIRASIDASLKRLNTDHIDLYYQHRLDPKIPIEEVARVIASFICDLTLAINAAPWASSPSNCSTIKKPSLMNTLHTKPSQR